MSGKTRADSYSPVHCLSKKVMPEGQQRIIKGAACNFLIGWDKSCIVLTS